MDDRLIAAIRAYQRRVAWAMGTLEQAGIPRPNSNTEWACNGIPQRGELPGGVSYFKHGYGVAVHDGNGAVDFDFGDHGEITGFNVSRLWGFLESTHDRLGFRSKEELELVFERDAAEGELRYSGYILYYVAEDARGA